MSDIALRLALRISSLVVGISFFILSGRSPAFGVETGSCPLRQDILLRDGWEFHKGDSVPKSGWESVSVPHDWAIYGPFDISNDLQTVTVTQNLETVPTLKTGRTGGLPYIGIGRYRRTFSVPSGKRAELLFDGAMSEAEVYVNGSKVCFWPNGYNAFHCDVTKYVKSEEDNLLEVRLENRPSSSRWYPGAGLYRDVHLIFTDEVHVPVWGTYVTTPHVGEDFSSIKIRTEVEAPEGTPLSVVTAILASDGTPVAEKTLKTVKVDGALIEQSFTIDCPSLWSPESPSLYSAVTKVYAGERLCDEYSTKFGIRSVEFIPEKGFFLNGKPRKFQGVCNHHDLGPLGAAVSESAIRHQLLMLKDMGCDAIRTTHNMPAPGLVRLCDEMGFMVIVEAFDEWDVAKCANGYHRFFADWAEKDMVNMIRQFRSSPSVVLWSIGNEVPTQCMPEGFKVARFLQEICHREDPSRMVTCGMDQVSCVLANGFASVIDVPGLNYRTFRYLEAYENLPQGFILGSETGSTVSSRGVYKLPAVKRFGQTDPDHQCSSYDLDACGWSNVPDIDFALAEDWPWTLGQFVWTGFDYLGEPSPYDTDSWPNHSSMFGIIDLASIPKDRFWLFRSVWNRAESTLHILPHWNWEGREGSPIPVFVYTSWPEAELFLNGKSLGRVRKVSAQKPTLGGVREELEPRYRLMWPAVSYEPGELKAVAYDSLGNAVQENVVRTAGKPHHVEFEWSYAEADALPADGESLAYVTVTVVDKDGNLCPTDGRLMHFEVSGAGEYRAAANGDPTCLDLFHEPRMHAFGGRLTVILRSGKESGDIVLKVAAKGLKTSEYIIPVVSK